VPANNLNLRQRFTLWIWNGRADLEVAGDLAQSLGVDAGPYTRDITAERAAEKILKRNPTAPIWITREALEVVELPRDSVMSASVLKQQWIPAGIVWQNPAGAFPQPPSDDR
jgi:hypothetical protein